MSKTKLTTSFLGSVKANISATLLLIGTFMAKVISVTVRPPKHEGADFDFSDEFEQIGITFESMNRGGEKARATAYISFQGFVNYDKVDSDAKAAPFVAGLTAKDLSVTAAEFKSMPALKKFRAAFRRSELTGDAVSRKTNKRLTDMILDSNGAPVHADEQGANTKAAMEIATKVASRLGLGLEELIDFDPNNTNVFAQIEVNSKTYRDSEKITVNVLKTATEEQFDAFCEDQVDA
jgi:hypothetical protein